MSERNFKEIRKQLRTVVREIIDEVLTQEICAAAQRQVQENIDGRLNVINAEIKTSLDKIGDSAKEFQGYVMRELANRTAELNAQAADTSEAKPATVTE